MAVLPGATSNRPTPGGMPDSRQMGRVGPSPSLPKMGAGPAEFGSVAGVPNPDDLVDLFTAYTSGQMSRDDLIGQLHTFSEGQGGILGLLEGMDQGDTGSRTGMSEQAVDVVGNQGGAAGITQPVMPGGVMPGVGLEVGGVGAQGGQGALGQSAGLGAIPELTEPLDQRHQRISLLLQGFGLQLDDADQMSTLLNPHVKGHKRVWSEDEQLWYDTYDDVATGDIAYDPTVTAEQIKATPSIVRGTGAQEMRAEAGTGMAIGSKGAGTVQKYDKDTGLTNIVNVGDVDLQKRLDPGAGGFGTAEGGSQFIEQAWTAPEAVPATFTRTTQADIMPGATTPEQWKIDQERTAYELAAKQQADAEQARLDREERQRREEAMAAMDEELFKNTANFHPMFGGTLDIRKQGLAVQDREGNWFPDQKSYRAYAEFLEKVGKFWNGDQIEFASMIGGQPQPEKYYVVEYGGEQIKFRTLADAQKFGTIGQYPDGKYLPGFDPKDRTKDIVPKGTTKEPTVVVNADGTTTTTAADGTVTITGQQGEIISVTPPGAAGGDDEFADILGSLTPKPQFDPSVVDSNKYPDLAKFISGITEAGTTSEAITGTIINAIKDMETIKAQEGQNQFQRMMQTSIAQLDRQAVLDRADLDRKLQEGVAIGEIADTATLAKTAEENAQLMREYQLSGMMPAAWQADPEAAGVGVKTLAREEMEVRITQAEAAGVSAGAAATSAEAQVTGVAQRREQELSELFGKYIGPETDPTALMQTLEREKWGFTIALAKAEQTGVFDISAPGTGEAQANLIAGTTTNDQDWLNRFFTQGNPEDLSAGWVAANLSTRGKEVQKQIQAGINAGTGITGVQTLSAKRLAFEKDIAVQKNNWEERRLDNEAQSITNQQQINNYSISSNASIEAGRLSEAVASRKAKYKAEADKLQLDKDKLKIETLLSLSDPATFLFATRFGLLDNLGITLGVDFSDEIYPGEIPLMLEPGTIPTMQQLRAATPAERQIMLAEMASSGGYSVEEALSRVQAGTPGGRAIQRQRNVAVVR